MADTLIETLVAVVKADISQLQDGLKAASSQMKDLGSTLTAGLTLPIIGFGVAAVKAFSDSQTEAAQLNAVLKSTKSIAGVTAKAATDLATALQKTTRFSDEAVLSTENLLLTFTSIHKDIFPQATKTVLDMATALGEDTKSAAIQLGKALQDPITGITALRRVGVNFTDAQKKQIEAMVKAGNLMGAQQLILKELQTEFGGSAEAAGNTFAGSLDKLKNKFDDLLETIGAKLAPTLEKGIGFLSGLIDKIGALPPGVIELGLAIAGIAAAAGPVLTILGNLGALIAIVFSPAALIIGGIIAVLKIASDHFGGLGNMIKVAVTAAQQLIQIVGFEVFDALQKASTAAGQLASIVGFFLFKTLNDAATAATQLGQLALLTLFDWLNRAAIAAGQLGFIISFALGSAVTWIKARLDELVTTIKGVVKWLQDTWEAAQNFLNVPTGQRGATGGAAALANNPQLATNPIEFLARSLFGFASGGYTGNQSGVAGVVHGGEYVVPQQGALVMRGGRSGPDTIHIVLQAENFEDHLFVKVAGLYDGEAA